MKYFITYKNPLEHLLDIRLRLNVKEQSLLDVKLPIWRPGRYEAANYAKNIQKIKAHSYNGSDIAVTKIKPSHWQIDCEGVDELEISYLYYAHTMDAGNSLLDENMVYINFINCMFYVEDLMEQPHEIELDLPSDYLIACSLKNMGPVLVANSYFELADSPLIASNSLEHYEYQVKGRQFHIWIQGSHNLDIEKLVDQFQLFSRKQIEVMGEFPVSEYHFLFHILPYKHYHGVEHGSSTVICLGPKDKLAEASLYNELLGVSSHELFHAWNIIKIRPKELLPYNFGTPVIFPTGFVAEGFTTYYGDLFLKRSGVFSLEEYLNELNKLFARHFLNFGRLNNSVVDSSLDLWFDGYQPSAPHKKSSIYVEGAIIALLLDLQIRQSSDHENSLDDVMRILWEKFGQQNIGYGYKGIVDICGKFLGARAEPFFEDYVYGTKETSTILRNCLADFGLTLTFGHRTNPLERHLGIILQKKPEGYEILSVEPRSAGAAVFSIRDIIKTVDEKPLEEWLDSKKSEVTQCLVIERQHEEKKIELVLDEEKSYFKVPKVSLIHEPTSRQKAALESWLEG